MNVPAEHILPAAREPPRKLAHSAGRGAYIPSKCSPWGRSRNIENNKQGRERRSSGKYEQIDDPTMDGNATATRRRQADGAREGDFRRTTNNFRF